MFILAEGATAIDLLKLLPEGVSVSAVIITVVLFLRQQREQSRQIKAITEAFNARIKEITDTFQAQVDRLTKQIFDHQNAQQIQMQSLFDGFMEISRETVKAVVELKAALDNLSQKIRQK